MAQIAAKRLQATKQKKTVDLSKLGIGEYITHVTPEFENPVHFKEVADAIDDVLAGNQRIITFAAGPRHGKSELIFHTIVKYLAQNPTHTVAYCCYGAKLAEDRSRNKIRPIAVRAGLELSKDQRAAGNWKLVQGGGVVARGLEGALTGLGVNLIVIDDPFRDRAEAESPTIRQNVYDWFTSTCFTRGEPNSSVIITQCIAKDEPILMASGEWKPVQDVVAGDLVKAFEAGGFVNRRVIAQRLSGNDPILLVSTDRKSLRVNAKHPFLLESGEWCKAGDLKPTDRVVVYNAGTGTETVDPEWAWFIGYMMGDGWVTSWERQRSKSGKKYTAWCVCVAKCIYPELNERAIAAFEKFFGKRPVETKFGYYRLDSKLAGQALVAAGVTGGAWGKRIPDWVFRLTPELKEAYLGGYIDADGSIATRCKDSYYVASVSKDLIEDTRRLAISAGVSCGRIHSSSQIVKAPHSKVEKLSTAYKLFINFGKSPDRVETIKSIEATSPADVYDLTVAGAENFIANGFVVHNTRWSQDDLIGRVVANNPDMVTEFSYPVLKPDGTVLWPGRNTLESLERIRKVVGEYDWASLYMQQPRPRGAGVFHATHLVDSIPDEKLKVAVGIDLAYTAKTYSDWSVAVVLGKASNGDVYVLNVLREQCSAPVFISKLKGLLAENNWPPVFTYIGGTEKGVTDFFVTQGVKVRAEAAKADKFVRAQPVAAAWNNGRVFLPKGAAWLNDFVNEVLAFTGIGDKHDDQVDALAGAFAQLTIPPPARGLGQDPIFPF